MDPVPQGMVPLSHGRLNDVQFLELFVLERGTYVRSSAPGDGAFEPCE